MEATPTTIEPAGQPPVAPTSLFARLCNMFVTPTEVFDEAKVSPPSTGNWLVPVFLGIIVGAICVVALYSQPAFLQKIKEQQTKAFDKQVEAGKMTQAQADQAQALTQKFMGPTFLIGMGIVGVFAVMFIKLFWWALILWLIGKLLLKSTFPYQKAMEVAGLTLMIGVLGGIIVSLLTVCFGDLTPLNLALLDRHAEPTSLRHLLLANFDIFDLWCGFILALGLSRLAGVSYGRALIPVAVYWLGMDAFIICSTMLSSHFSTGIK